MSLPFEVNVAEEGVHTPLLGLSDSDPKRSMKFRDDREILFAAGSCQDTLQLHRKLQSLEERLEEELLKTGKALRKDFREELSQFRPAPPQVEAKVVDQVSQLEGRLATVEALVPSLATVMQRHCEMEVTPSQVTSLREEVKEMQAEISKMCWSELKSKVDALGECFQVTNTVVRNDLGSRSCEMEGLKEEVRQIHQRFDGELSALKLQLTQQLNQEVKDHVSKLFETSAEPSTMQRLEGLEIEQRSEKEHFEKLVKYCESSLQGLKDDLDEHVSELRSEMAGRSLEVEGMKLSERMDQLWSKCTEWDLGFRELQWKVSKVSEQTATQHLADIAAQAELCALREELEGCRVPEETKLQEEVKKLSDQCTSAATLKELQGVQEQVTALWRQTVALTDEMEVLSPAVKEDLLSWKSGITSRVAEHEGRLKCLAETTAMQTAGRGGVATTPGERPDVQLSDEMLMMRMDLHSLREQVAARASQPGMEKEQSRSMQQDLAQLREELQSLPRRSDLQHLRQEVLELTKSTAPAIGSSDFTQLREEVQSLPRQSDLQQLRQEVLELTKSTAPAIGSSDFTQLREEVQSLPRQSDLQQLRQEFLETTHNSEVKVVTEQFKTSAQSFCREPITEAAKLTDMQPVGKEVSIAIWELVEKEVEKRFSHSDQRMESIRDFCSARLESINESCSSLEKDLSKLKETFRDEQKAHRSSLASLPVNPFNENGNNMVIAETQETDELKSQVLRLRGDLSRLEKAFESRDTEETFLLHPLALGVLKVAQFLGVTTEEACDKVGWKEACSDLARMVDHAWLRHRIPEKASMVKLLRQKADLETVQGLQVLIEDMASFMKCNAMTESMQPMHVPHVPTTIPSVPSVPSETRQQLGVMTQLLQQLRRLQKVEEPRCSESETDFRSQWETARMKKRPSCSGRSYTQSIQG